jgi:NAD(P)-dependent dehydrogenase (short-subunit alcohol dehydrogenase family)
MRSRTVVVTGASSGIGAAAGVELARRGATVVAVGRDEGRLAAVSERIRAASPDGAAAPLQADFSSLADVRKLADELCERHAQIHVLINNAGLVAGTRSLTIDGHETTIAVNHLAPFLLTSLLLGRLRESAPARVVTTSSDAHRSGHLELDDLNGERRWSPWSSYSNSKLANVLFTRALARRLEGSDVTANCLHPGVIRTRLGRGSRLPVRLGWRVASLFFKAPEAGASTIVHLASSDEASHVNGAYFVDSHQSRPSLEAQDDELAERLWTLSEQLVGLASETAS